MSNEMWIPVGNGEYAELEIEDDLLAINGRNSDGLKSYLDTYLPDNLRVCKRVEPEAITEDALMGARFERVCETNAGESVYTREFRTSAQEVLFSVHVVLLNNGTSVRLATGRYSDSRQMAVGTMQDLRTMVKMLGGAE